MSDIRRYLRFPLRYRLEHWISVGSFITLAITGLAQKFALHPTSVWIVEMLGGIEPTRRIHRTAAIILMLEVVYHIGAVGYSFFVKRAEPKMLPGIEDVHNAWQSIRYYLGLDKRRPQQDRYTFEEKAEYWAFVWGTLVMALTGFIMWNPIATTRFFPGQVIPAAKAAHGNEALLAVLAIILWHVYHVHIRTFNKSMFTGYLTEEEMIEDHPKALADRKAGVAERPIDRRALKRRQRIYLPVYSLVAVALVTGIYLFATFEQTAIQTVPPPESGVQIYAPFTPTPEPTATRIVPATTGAQPTTWSSGIGAIFEQRCTSCHGGDSPMAGFDATSYQGVLAGGGSGPGVVPGDPDGSQIIQRQITGNHPGQLTPGELAAIRDWIAAGAPE
jgi:formate dehydrogenase gamma subunit